MRYLSLCSGIEAATVAWHPLGWTPVAFSEIDKFPSAVLAHHYPGVPNWGDMTRFKEWPDAAIDLLVGGTPCQSFSVAGLRKGLADPRGNLMLVYLAIAERYRPRWLVWENVPGVLSSNGGRDFGAFVGALGELGYGWAYRSLDAQYAGLAQRRERVFVAGCLGSRHGAAAVLFERASLRGDPAPRREAGKDASICPTLRAGGNRTGGDRRPGTDVDTAHSLIARCVSTGEGTRQDYETTTLVAHSLRADGFDASEDGTGRGTPLVPIAFHGSQDPDVSGDVAHLVGRNQGFETCAYVGMQVRRLTPRECERLQGFPDDYTLIPYRGKLSADGPRYKAIGNSMAVPCMRWIGQRIAAVESIFASEV